jgi:hypothetical protein
MSQAPNKHKNSITLRFDLISQLLCPFTLCSPKLSIQDRPSLSNRKSLVLLNHSCYNLAHNTRTHHEGFSLDICSQFRDSLQFTFNQYLHQKRFIIFFFVCKITQFISCHSAPFASAIFHFSSIFLVQCIVWVYGIISYQKEHNGWLSLHGHYP